jgi:hypothetical protein
MRSATQSTNPLAFWSALFAVMATFLAFTASASAAGAWRIDSLSNTAAKPDALDDPSTAELTFKITLESVGGTTLDPAIEPIGLDVSLPPTMGAVGTPLPEWQCPGLIQGAQSFSCDFTGSPFDYTGGAIGRSFELPVAVDGAAGGTETATFAVSGGGAPPASTADPVRITATPLAFGLDAFDALIAGPSGQPFLQAGAHPAAVITYFDLNTANDPLPLNGDAYPVEAGRDVVVSAPPGLLGKIAGVPRCTIADLATIVDQFTGTSKCAGDSQVGTVAVRFAVPGNSPVGASGALYNMVPAVGEPARFGFVASGVVVLIDTRLRSESDYGVDFISHRISEGLAFAGFKAILWGTPSDASHDLERTCPTLRPPFHGGPSCAVAERAPLIRMPTACTAPGEGLPWSISADSWPNPGRELSAGRPDLSDPAWKSISIQSHKAPLYPFEESDWGEAQGPSGCAEVPVHADLSAKTTALEAETSSGLDVHVEVPQSGLELPDGIATSDIKAVKVSLPQGVTINPSQAEGLGTCSQARYESSELSFNPDGNHGCPSDSKIGTVQVKTPLLEETLPGDVYVATPYANPFGSLLAIYVVIEEPTRGVLVKLGGKVETDEQSGRIITSFEDLPQQPFSSFDFHFREGARAPLVTPPTCGSYQTEALFTPWSDPSRTLASTSSFQITKGIGGGPCPSGAPGFKPGFSAGSYNDNAGSYSPFYMGLTRLDGEQDMTRFSSVLPKGVIGKLAGLSQCSNAAIAAAKARTGPSGGHEELAAPSCPANSAIGRTRVGAGVGSVLTYVPGSLYLSGPYNGAPLSVVSITPGVAGPFDVGTVVVREALSLDPRTGEVHVDGDRSDPIPHILKGIPLKLRELEVFVDRPDFTLNPTSCNEMSARATLFGSALDVFSSADDLPVALSARYQAANCSRLGFKPRLSLKLKGGTRRGGHPALRATFRPRAGDANTADAVVKLPRSAFLDQAHIRTICTRVQFAQDSCPKGAIYGRVKALTPLLDEPLEGPVYLRSSNHKLPDLVFDLQGIVDVEVVGRIDSVRGGIRGSFEDVPDAPVSKLVLEMQGAKKGLIQNSRNLCRGVNRADAELSGQNGKLSELRPALKPRCRSARGS